MALLAEYALTPDVFDSAAYSSDEVCGHHLQTLKDLFLHDGLVRNLRGGDWAKTFDDASRPWHPRGKELLRKLRTQRRTVLADATRPLPPKTDDEWCLEALASHALRPLAGVISTAATAASHTGNFTVSSVNRLQSAPWWRARSPSLRLCRTLPEYQAALALVLRYANSLQFIDPFINPADGNQYGGLVKILESLKDRSVKPLIEVHRAAWFSGHDKRPQVNEVVAALHPALQSLATGAGISVEVFLWDEIHDRYLITDLIGISIPYGFGTTTAPDARTTWTRLGRADRDSVQKEFDPSYRKPHHRFTVVGT